jgi:hypothetical protein
MRTTLLSALTLLLATAAAAAEAPSYARQVKPFFARYCVECHNGEEPEGGLNLETYKSLMEGGGRGAALVPGKPDLSRLVRMVEGKLKPTMPPKKAKQPKPAEVTVVRAWVAAGARDDSAALRITLPAIKPRVAPATPVTALAYHPGGKLLAAAGRGEVLLLDAATGEVKRKVTGLRDRVTALAFSRDGNGLAVASSAAGEAHEVRVFAFGPAAGLLFTGPHADVIHGLSFSPDGKTLASCGYDRLIKLWDVAAGKELRALRDHSDAVYGVAFSPDGKLLASCSADRAVKVWDVATGARLYTLGEPTDWLYAVAWSPDGKHLAAAGVDRSIRVWEVSARGGKIVHSVFAHEAPVTRLAYSSGGATLYSLSEDGSARAWDSARMVERRAYPRQPETPLALAARPDGKQLAVGRYDGALLLLDEATGKVLAQPLPARPKPPVLEKLTPAAAPRGRSLRLRLEGKHLVGVSEVLAPLPGWRAVAAPGGKDTAVEVTVTVPPAAPPGVYPVRVKTAGGESKPLSFTVDRFDAVNEAEPNDSPRTGQKVTLPVTLVGDIGRAGDVDYFRFEARAGQEVGVQALTAAVGSGLSPVLRLVDPEGVVVAESDNGLLGYACPKAGTYSLGIRDSTYRGGPKMHYRLHVGEVPVVTSVFPLGVRRGSEAEVRLDGVHLGKARAVKLKVPADAAPGSRIPVPFAAGAEAPLGAPAVVVGEFPEVADPRKGGTLPVPGAANGVIAEAGAPQSWQFRARKGERLLIEVEARRLGSPLDSYLEVLDAAGRPLPRATLRCLARTYTTFRDHDSASPGIRIEAWSELAVNDYLLVGGELLRIKALPRNPDDDCQFFSAGGQRLGFLGTTPTHQPQGQPMYKVAIHPPGTTFPRNGLPVVTLFWRNDDGGPGFGKDSRLVFDAPADGTYQVRVGDARGEGGRGHAYRLTLRPPRPDFRVTAEHRPELFRGGAVPVRVRAERLDEFDGAISLRLLGLPPGLTAPATTVPAGENSTAFALHADAKAVLPAKPGALKLEARATVNGKEVVREAAVALPRLADKPDIVTTTGESEVAVRPGGETRLTVTVGRRNGFKGRIPVEVQGLPHGVRVLDVGLNGILITEAETTRTVVIQADPWVAPAAQPFVVFARREGKGTEHAARSVLLRVLPPGR